MRYTYVVVVVFLAGCATGSTARHDAALSADATDVIEALTRGDNAAALREVDALLATHPRAPWLHYNRGAALFDLGQTQPALDEFAKAELLFTNTHNKSLAVYQRVLLLQSAARCAEVVNEWSHYAKLVGAANAAQTRKSITVAAAPNDLCQPQPPPPAELAEREATRQLRARASDLHMAALMRLQTAAANAVMREDDATALALANKGLAIAPDDGWIRYNEGLALAGLGDTDKALAELSHAEAAFAADDVHARSVAIFARAFLQEENGRCAAAAELFRRYAAVVADTNPALAKGLSLHVRMCWLATRGQRF